MSDYTDPNNPEAPSAEPETPSVPLTVAATPMEPVMVPGAAVTAPDAPGAATPTSQIGVPSAVAQAPETPADAQQVSTHAIAPGSAGPAVAELAAKLEAAGEKTYLSDPNAQNPAHVFTDDLLQAVRRVLHSHPEIVDVVDEAERQRLNRWISGLEVVTAEVHKLIDEVAETKAAGQA